MLYAAKRWDALKSLGAELAFCYVDSHRNNDKDTSSKLFKVMAKIPGLVSYGKVGTTANYDDAYMTNVGGEPIGNEPFTFVTRGFGMKLPDGRNPSFTKAWVIPAHEAGTPPPTTLPQKPTGLQSVGTPQPSPTPSSQSTNAGAGNPGNRPPIFTRREP
jgi:hypothetical protein